MSKMITIMLIIIMIRELIIINMRIMRVAMSSMTHQSTALLCQLYLLLSPKSRQLAVTVMIFVVQLVRTALLCEHLVFVKLDTKTEMVIVMKFGNRIGFY